MIRLPPFVDARKHMAARIHLLLVATAVAFGLATLASVWDQMLLIRPGGVALEQLPQVMSEHFSLAWRQFVIGGLVAIATMAIGLWIGRSIAMPLRQLTLTMQAIRDGELELAVSGTGRTDELGDMARVIEELRRNTSEMNRLRAEQVRQLQLDSERTAMVAELLAQIRQAADTAAQGVFNPMHAPDLPEDLQEIVMVMNRLIASVRTGLSETSLALRAMASADLTLLPQGNLAGAYAELQADTIIVADRLVAVIGQLRSNVGTTDHLRVNADSLNGDVERRRTATAEVETELHRLTMATDAILGHLEQTRSHAVQMHDVAGIGQSAMAEAAGATQHIDTAARRIGGLADTIDTIAFETNMLSLNASLEAARAGQNDGFAAVALEVRRLSGALARASEEIRDLTEATDLSLSQLQGRVATAGAMFESMREDIEQNRQMLETIVAACADQQSAMAGIQKATRHIADGTQVTSNIAAQLDDAVAAAGGQATSMDVIIAQFRLPGANKTGRKTLAQAAN